MTTAVLVYLGLVLVTSVACFAAYGWDKRRARNGGRRVPEKTLHLIALFGGWPGALSAQRHFRHKTQKLEFRLMFWIVVLLHIAVIASVVLVVSRSSRTDAEAIVQPIRES